MRVAVRRRGLLLLVFIVIGTVVGAIRLDDPWRALLIALGAGLAFAEATAVGRRLADGLLWLAAQLLPADVRSDYLQMWRADLVEPVDGQGPISFALDVLLSGPLTAVTTRQTSQTTWSDRRGLPGSDRLWPLVEAILPIVAGGALLLVPTQLTELCGLILLLHAVSWDALRLVTTRGQLVLQLSAMAAAVGSIQVPLYSVEAYAAWAVTGMLAVLALRCRFAWSGPRTTLLAVGAAVPVSLFGASRWDYFGHDLAPVVGWLVLAPGFVMLGRAVVLSEPWAAWQVSLCTIGLLAAFAALVVVALSPMGWMRVGLLLSVVVGVVIELRRPTTALAPSDDVATPPAVAP